MELSEELLKQVFEYTSTDYGKLQLNDNAYVLIEDLINEISKLKAELESKESCNCDYDPEIEVPEIHGIGISL